MSIIYRPSFKYVMCSTTSKTGWNKIVPEWKTSRCECINRIYRRPAGILMPAVILTVTLNYDYETHSLFMLIVTLIVKRNTAVSIAQQSWISLNKFKMITALRVWRVDARNPPELAHWFRLLRKVTFFVRLFVLIIFYLL